MKILISLVCLLAIATGVVITRSEAIEDHSGLDDTKGGVSTMQMERRIHPVATVSIELSDGYHFQQQYLGQVVASRRSELGFERTGRIVLMDVNEGDSFSAGDVMAQLDTDRLVEQRQELLARSAEIVAKLDELVAGPRPEVIAAAAATVKDLSHQLELAQRNLERRRKLVGKAMAAREELEAADFGAQSTAAKLEVARHRWEELKAGTRSELIVAQRSVLAQNRSLLAQNQIEMERSVIRAPYGCKVTRQMADVGQIVPAGTRILEVMAIAMPEVWIGVPPTAAETLRPGCKTSVRINRGEYPAEIKNVLPQLDPATRTLTVILSLTNTTINQVPVGQTARLAIDRRTDERGCWLPIDAMVKGTRGLWSCFRVVPKDPDFEFDPQHDGIAGRLERCDVEVLHSDGDRVYVRSALDHGDRVVAGGTNRVAPGQWVLAMEIAS